MPWRAAVRPNTINVTLAFPDLSLRYQSLDLGSVELGQRGLVWNACESGLFRFAVVAPFDLGRKDKDTSAFNPIRDDRPAGMGVPNRSVTMPASPRKT